MTEYQQQGAEAEEMPSMMWEIQYRMPSEGLNNVSSLEFDTSRELLFAGHDTGHVTAYSLEQMEIYRYSSFRASKRGISHILPHGDNLFTVSATGIGYYTNGGLKLMDVTQLDDLVGIGMKDQMLTCAAVTRSSGGLLTPNSLGTHLVVGCTGERAWLYDLIAPEQPVLTYDVQAASACVRSSQSGHFLGVGGGDGRIRLLDGRLRSRRVEKTLDAHTGNVLSMTIDEDAMTLVSCGMIGRAINPYDPRSPKTYQPDHVVRVFDLRMMAQRAPLPAQLPAPFFVDRIAQDPTMPRINTMENDYIAISVDGYMQTCSLGESLDVSFAESTNEVGITCAGVSSSGDYVAVACGNEIIHLSRQYQEGGRSERVVNHHSISVDHPSDKAVPGGKPLPLSTYCLGTSYVLPSVGSSSNLKGGGWGKRILNTHSSTMLSEDFVRKVSYQQGSFIGTASRPKEVSSNTMLFGDRSRSEATRIYAVLDPRKTEAAAADGSDLLDVPAEYRRVISHRGKQRMNQFDYKSFNSENVVGLENSLQNSRFMNATLQTLFLLPEICANALKAQMRDYHHRKQTVLCELGFLLQMMMTIQKCADGDESIPRVAIPSNFERVFKNIPEAVALDLFDLKEGTTKNEATGSSNEATQNRIQTFSRFILQHLKIEEDSEKKEKGNSNTIIDEIFSFAVTTKKTFLQSGTQEVSTGNKLLGLDIIYPASETSKAKTAAGPVNTTKTVDATPPSFALVLSGSIKKETSVRGWCASSQTYEPLKQTRSLDTKTAALPKVLSISTGSTIRDVTEGTLENVRKVAENHHHTYWSKKNKVGGSWLPVELEVLTILRENEEMIISELLSRPAPAEGENTGVQEDQWLIFDKTERLSKKPASEDMKNSLKPGTFTAARYRLFAIISQITSGKPSWSHAVVHTRSVVPGVPSSGRWRLFNDFRIQSCSEIDVTSFEPRRHPCMLYFARDDYVIQSVMDTDMKAQSAHPFHFVSIPDSVLKLPSLSSHTSLSSLMLKAQKGDLIAFDAEFVSVEIERSELSSSGHRVVSDEGRQVLARISLLNEEGCVMLDDYILPSEPIMDYVTRFSGLVADDLDPQQSKHALVDSRTAYLKLRYLMDKGCIFVGHGLQKDFETANIYVPPEQILDTVELWRLPAQRKISLRFLAGYILKSKIQDEIHDSIEDALTALRLYKHYREVEKKGSDALEAELEELYSFGNRTNWTLGLDDISPA